MESQATAATIAEDGQTTGRDGAAGLIEKRMLIDGQLVGAERTFESINPATGEVIGRAPDATVEQAKAAIAAARTAFDTTTWATDKEFRIRCLEQLHQALVDNLEELRELTIADVGASRSLTVGPQLEQPIESVKYFADVLRDFSTTEELGEIESRGQQHRRWVEKEPAGVVSAIIAYNYPNQLALAKLAPSLAAGCTIVLKAAPDTPLITLALGELIAEHTDIPAGVVNIISSSDIEVGKVMTTDPAVDLVTFTGSTPTGRAIMAAASETVKRVFLELGGKSAMVLLDDAEINMPAVFAAYSICSHAGQGCAITTRLVVPREKHDEIVGLVDTYLGNIPYGDPSDAATYMGPLISEKQRDKVDALVKRAVADGATLVRGGEKIDPGFFYAPTLLTNVDPNSEIAQEELFGPVLVVIAHDGDDDAVAIANNSIYGLAGGVFSADEDRAIAVARRIRSGAFSINGGLYFGHDTPFGGFKQSGIGREMGIAGLEEFLERKTFATVVQ